jgi:hypothetical protein
MWGLILSPLNQPCDVFGSEVGREQGGGVQALGYHLLALCPAKPHASL